MTLIFFLHQDLNDYLPQALTTATQIAIHETPLPSIDLQSLQSLINFMCDSPLTQIAQDYSQKEQLCKSTA